ncbi:polysaccharide pyruvyl transferase family protein [Flavobacteriaceae bacterium SZ-1-7]|uniref:polysaccharide pyruvyl transferase family protein n=1 Tax=Tamlana sedimenti TaxID=3134126 RepID=UPI0031236E5D
MKNILIKNFKNLNNYGSGMMGLITIKQIHELLNGQVRFYSDFDEHAEMKQILNELNGNIEVNVYKPPVIENKSPINSISKRISTLKYILSNKGADDFDMVIVLGGDDLSEYYGKHVWPVFLSLYSWSFKTKIILFGQSIGPFKFWLNKFSFKKLANRCKIFTRDEYCFNYLKDELGITKNVTLSGDIAFLNLPLETDKAYEQEILTRYNLKPNGYISIVISGLLGKYYTESKSDYFNSYKQLIERLKALPEVSGKKICFLSHTFPPHGDEAGLLAEFESYLGSDTENLVFIKDKVYQAGARFILGNGLMTITGRMHASVSTFEMIKPSISLAYSVKYYGVIGDNLKRNDLIIDANTPALWSNGEIVTLIIEKVKYLIDNYNTIIPEIDTAVNTQKKLVNSAFNSLTNNL